MLNQNNAHFLALFLICHNFLSSLIFCTSALTCCIVDFHERLGIMTINAERSDPAPDLHMNMLPSALLQPADPVHDRSE